MSESKEVEKLQESKDEPLVTVAEEKGPEPSSPAVQNIPPVGVSAPVTSKKPKGPKKQLKKQPSDKKEKTVKAPVAKKRVVAEKVPTSKPKEEKPKIGGDRPKPLVKGVSEFMIQRTYTVPSSDEKAIEFCVKQGIPHFVATKNGKRLHEISHLCREVGTARILASAIPAGVKKATVLDWYGSERTKKLSPAQSYPICSVTEGKMGPVIGLSKDVLSIEFTNAPNLAIAGDGARGRGAREALPFGITYDAVIMVDIYQSGRTWDTPLTVDVCKELIGRSKSREVYWLGRIFPDECGVDDSLEGAYFKDEKGMVNFSPSATEQPYAAHPWPEWLLQRSVGGLDIAELFSLGPFKAFKITLSAPGAIDLPPVFPASSWVARKQVSQMKEGILSKLGLYDNVVVDVLSWLNSGFEEKYCRDSVFLPVHLPTANVMAAFALRVPTGSAFDNANAGVLTRFLEDPKLVELSKRYPNFYSALLEGTRSYVLFGSKAEIVDRLVSYRGAVYRTELALSSVRGTAPVRVNEMRPWLKTFLSFLASAGVGYLITRKLFSELRVLVIKGRTLLFEVLKAVKNHMSIFSSEKAAKKKRDEIFNDYLAPFIEECMKYVLPPLGVLMGLWEYLGLASVGANGLFNLLFHSGTGLIYYFVKKSQNRYLKTLVFLSLLGFHHGYNKQVTKNQNSKGNLFIKLHDEGTEIRTENSEVLVLPLGARLEGLSTVLEEIPNPLRGELTCRVDGFPVGVKDCAKLVNSDGGSGMWPYMASHRLPFQPKRSEANLFAAVVLRRMRDPQLPPREEIREAWSDVHDICRQLYRTPIVSLPSWEEATRGMKDRGKRALLAKTMNELGLIHSRPVSLFVKTNETIPLKNVGTERTQLKPRTIVNFDPIDHAETCQMARAVSDAMHETMDGQVHHFEVKWGEFLESRGFFSVQIFFASGYTQAQLTEVGRAMQSGSYNVIVISGDDSACKWQDPRQFGFEHTYTAYDQSQFDVTQGDVCLEESLGAQHEALHVDTEYTKKVLSMSKAKFKCERHSLKMVGETESIMPTGITSTTGNNSHNTLMMYLTFIYARMKGYQGNLESWAKKLGFKTSGYGGEELVDIDFLKGWWINDTKGEPIWYPLPSATIKAGKIMNDPREIYNSPDWNTAYKKALHAGARSYGMVDPQYPIFGAFIKRSLELGVVSETERPAGDEKYQHVEVQGTVDRASALVAINRRYGLTEVDVERVEALYSSVERLPAVVLDPAFDALADKDYGGDSSLVNLEYLNSVSIFKRAAQIFVQVMRRARARMNNGEAMKTLANIAGGASTIRRIGEMVLANKTHLRGRSTQVAEISKSVPNAIGTRTVTVKAQSALTAGGGIRVKNRELLSGGINGTTSFALFAEYALNPGLAATFPWLAPQANQYEQYRFHSVKFIYIPIVPTTVAGDIMLMADYNPVDPTPQTEVQMVNHPGAITAALWEPVVFNCSVKDMHALGPRKFVRSGNLAGDLKTFDVGNFYVATNNLASSVAVGKLFVEYDVEFFIPQLTPTLTVAPAYTSYFTHGAAIPLTTTVARMVPFSICQFGTQLNGVTTDALNVAPGRTAGGLFTPPTGVYKLRAQATFQTTANEATLCYLYFQVNGAVYPSGQYAIGGTTTSATVQNIFLSADTVVACPGTTTTVALWASATGATGTLTIPIGMVSLIWELA